MTSPLQHRYDFVYLFDVTDGNPNGDPDAGNLPRVDPETGQGLVTDVCLKRKVRDYVEQVTAEEANADIKAMNKIFVRSGTALNAVIADAHEATGGMPQVKEGKWLSTKDKTKKAGQWLCANYFDIRTFGAVLSTGPNAGQIRGPVQLTISRSISPILSSEFSITRCATTDDKVKAKAGVSADTYKQWEASQSEDTLRTMGRKFTVPYGLYRGFGYINASLAGQTGFSEEDLDLFKQALNLMFEHDRSAARGLMKPVRCIAFKHEHKLGNARADQLFSRVKVARKDAAAPPRAASDYDITLDNHLPPGVTVEEWVS